ncbi:lysophospholipid acyltransferase family protein [Chloroflexota bacterium]
MQIMPWFYYVGRTMVWMLLILLTNWRVRGKENIPSQGSLLIVANHINLSDPPILGTSLNRKVVFMAKEELFRSKLTNYFIRGFGAFPVHRGQLDRTALRQADQVLAQGRALVMFPEGMRSHSSQLRRALPGAARIAQRSGSLILPVGITGTEKIKGLSWLLHRPKLTVNIGHPFHLPAVSRKSARGETTELTGYIMEQIAKLLPLEYRGHYTEREN